MMQTTSRFSLPLRRMLQMKLPELVTRGKQETFKFVDRLRITSASPRPSSSDPRPLERFLQHSQKSFFAGAFDVRLPAALAIAASKHCTEMMQTADSLSHGRFDLLGYKDLQFGNPPDWHLDPVANRRAPSIHWSRIDPLNHARVGDSKVIWELNRHQWLVTLGQCYTLTRNERYPETIVRHLQDWLRANPRGVGINWASSLEVGFRLIAWSWALVLIRNSPALTAEVFNEVLGSVEEHATHVEQYLSYYFSPNTHLTGEALGLFYAGVLFPDLDRAARWRSLGAEILVQEAERQVLPDGVYFERSTCYQRYTADIYLHFLILARRAGIEVAPVISNTVRSLVEVLVALRQPDGTMPSIGDADGGLLLPLSKPNPNNFSSVFSTAAVFFSAPEYAWAAGDLAPETLWLMGSASLETFRSIDPAPPKERNRIFADGGFAVMRSGWNKDAHALVFDTGPLGCPVSSGHGHADLLSIQCAIFGRPYLVDPGTGCYTGDSDLRNFFRGTAAHSTVVVDGKSQSQPTGPFSWESRCKARLRQWTTNDSLVFADADHDAYQFLPDPVLHRRRVLFVRSRYWLVIDDVVGADRHGVEVRFQFAPMQVRVEEDGWSCATADGERGLLLKSFSSAPLESEVREGRSNPREGWISPNYGQVHPAPVLVYSATAQLPVRIVTVLWPADVVTDVPAAEVIRDARGFPTTFLMPDRLEAVAFLGDVPVLQ